MIGISGYGRPHELVLERFPGACRLVFAEPGQRVLDLASTIAELAALPRTVEADSHREGYAGCSTCVGKSTFFSCGSAHFRAEPHISSA